MYKCSSCGYVGAAVVEFPEGALKKLQKAERLRNRFRQQRKRRPPKY